MTSIEIRIETDLQLELELADVIAALEGVKGIDQSPDQGPDGFGAETVALIWLVTVAGGSAATFIARTVHEIRRRSSHGIIVDLTGESPSVTSLKDHPVARGTILIKSPEGSEVRLEEVPKIVDIAAIIKPLLSGDAG